MKRSRWEGVSAVWNGIVFLCFCSGLPRSGEPQNDICKVELQFSLSLSIHTYIHIIIYTCTYITYPMICIPHSPSTMDGMYKSFDGPSLELDLKKSDTFLWLEKSFVPSPRIYGQTHPNSTPSHCTSKLLCGRLQFL